MTEEEHCSYRGYQEPFDIFNSRINKFEKELEKRCKEYNKILLIGHSYFFNCWYTKECHVPANGKIIRLKF